MIVRIAMLGFALVVMTGAVEAKPLDLKLAFFGGPKTPTYAKVLVPWAKKVSLASKGTIDISTFPGGSLGRNPRVQVKLVLDGVVDLGFFVPAYTPGRFPDNAVMELPGLLRDANESGIAIWRLYKRGLLRGYDKFKVLMLVTTAPYTIHTNFPVKRIEDLKGKKLRAGGPVAGATIRALGAIPVGMPIPAVAQNISKGIIAGSATDWNVLYAFRIVDVAKNHYMGVMGTVPIGLIMNINKFNGLPAAARAAFEKFSGEKLARENGKVNVAVNKMLQAKTRKNKQHVFVDLDAAAQKKWDAIVNPVVDQWVEKHPKGKILLAALKEELAAIRAEKK